MLYRKSLRYKILNNRVLIIDRCIAYGKSDFDKKLTVVFTIRKNRIRVISARTMSKKERLNYEKA